jgi:two-component system, OmpR family, sensor histidine kinase ChvG
MRRFWQRLRSGAASRIGWMLLAFNLLIVFVPAMGVLYLDVYEARLLEWQERAMVQQARLVSAAASELTDPASIERLFANLERRTESRLRVYDAGGAVIADSIRATATPIDDDNYAAQRSPGTRAHVLYRVGDWLADFGDWVRSFRGRRTGGTADADDRRDTRHAPELQAALAGRPYGTAVRATPGQRSLTLYSAMPIRRQGEIVGAVVVSQSTFRILQALYESRLRVFEVVLASIAVAGALSIVAGFRIVRPIVRLRRQANALAARRGPLPAAFPGSSRRDEIGDLARALEDLTRRLDEHIRLLESFAADVAHEFKNPLASIRTAAEMMDQASDAAERDRFRSLMMRDVDRLERLVTGIRDLARIDGQIESDPLETVDVRALVSDVAEGLRLSMAAEHPIELQLSGEGPALVRGSAERLRQVFENLMTNAVSFTAPGTTVGVTVDADGSECRVAVADRGPGIPEAHLQRVFDRFFTYRPASGRREHIGLGLAIAHAIVERYGGTVTAANRSGGGAIFEVRLRRAPRAVAQSV